jgi:lipoate-protein ligase A
MIRRIYYYVGESVDPYQNLAIEQYLMETVAEDACILYLWQNSQTVVIGRNQNAWAECRTTELNQDGGHLARRLSGGGAVFHDLGNLNFTFLLSKKNYDVAKQLQVIVEACRNLGLDAQVTGRNDVTIDGRKFSGNAFYDSKGQAYHHGTLLVDVDMTMLGKYLMPSKAKLQSKGVDSVRSRVVNLRELCPALTIDRMKEEMLAAFQKVYGLESEVLNADRFDGNYVNRLWERNASWDWNYGKSLPASFVCEDRFPWGGIQLQLQVERGYVKTIQVYSDAMEWNIAAALRETLENCAFTQQTLLEAIQAAQLPQNIQQDLCRLIETQNL